MKKLITLHGNERGAAAVEFALCVPILVSLIYGIFEFSQLYWANAGMQHALGEGARYATIYDSTTTNHVPTDANIKATMDAKVFGPNGATFNTSVTTPASTTCTSCRLLTVTYSRTMNFLFFTGPTITLTRSKQVYVVA
jgi:Flp pilus assembly protein TadG